jgi:hypothetical protein
MNTQTHIESELLGLIEFIESGLLTPGLRRHLAEFPTLELKIAAGDLLDWLSLRAILRDRVHQVRGTANLRVERLVQCLPESFHYVCVHEGCLAYRAAITLEEQHALEDFIKERIWHPDVGRQRQKSQVR